MKKKLQVLLLAIPLLVCNLTTKAQSTNYSMDFDGSTNFVNLTNGTASTGLRSIEFWFKPTVTINSSTSIPGAGLVIRHDAQIHEFGVYIRGTDWSSNGNVGALAFYVRHLGTLHEIISNSNSWVAGTWYHVAAVLDPTAGMLLYINGVLQTNTDATLTSSVETDNSNLIYFGTWGNAGVRYFNGEIDEARLWNRAISQTEIQTKKCQTLVPANETGLQAYFQFNEGSGTQVLDATTNAFNGNVSGATWINDNPCSVPNPGNYSMDFNGTNNYVTLGNTAAANGIRSIEFWFKPTISITSSTNVTAYAFIERDDAQQHEFGVYLKGTDFASSGNVGKIAFYGYFSGTIHEIISNSSTWNAGTWYHVAGVIDPTAGMMLYIDGVLQTSTNPSITSTFDTDNSSATCFGTWGSAHVRYFNGEMDEARLWNRAISQSEIQAKKCQTLVPANETGLQAYFQFNEGSGTQVLDATTNSFNGVVSGAIWILDGACTTIGIEKNTIKENIKLYPNPSSGIVNIQLLNSVENSIYKIYNTLGQEVKSGYLTQTTNQIDLQDLTTGIYNIIVIQNEKTTASKICIEK